MVGITEVRMVSTISLAMMASHIHNRPSMQCRIVGSIDIIFMSGLLEILLRTQGAVGAGTWQTGRNIRVVFDSGPFAPL